MTRLHQALERARAMDGVEQPTPIRGTSAPDSKAPGAPTPRIPVAAPFSFSCPKCGTGKRGLQVRWLRTLLSWMRIPLYRCSFCRTRFSGFGTVAPAPPVQQWGAAFLSPPDKRSFHDVIQDMAREERERTSQERRLLEDRRGWNRERRLLDVGMAAGDRRLSDRRVAARRLGNYARPDIIVTARPIRSSAVAPFVIPQNGPRQSS
jgi:hypothetical protein